MVFKLFLIMLRILQLIYYDCVTVFSMYSRPIICFSIFVCSLPLMGLLTYYIRKGLQTWAVLDDIVIDERLLFATFDQFA